MKKLTTYILAAATVLSACNKQIDDIKPLTKIDQQGELSSVAGIVESTVGNYKNLSINGSLYYDFALQDLADSRGNDVTLQNWAPASQYTDAFFFQNSMGSTTGESANFYRGAYQVIIGTNLVLEGISTFKTSAFASLTTADQNKVLYAEGENKFLRAFTYFNLARIYGKPYYQAGDQDLAVPLKTSSAVSDVPARAKVKDVYAFITSELQAAAQLMKAPVSKTNSFASTAAAWSLLSRVYLYMGGSVNSPDVPNNKLAASYADSAINKTNGAYALLQGSDYSNMFGDDEMGTLGKVTFSGNKEIILAYDNANLGSPIGILYHYYPDIGMGAIFLPSANLRSLFVPADVRGTFFKLNVNSGYVETTKWLCLNQGGVTRAPNIFLRLGEVYLNRAEANAKLGNFTLARNDLATIHQRAGLPASDISGLPDAGVLGAVLKERRMELAFEGHSSFDYFRNGLPMIRTAADNNGTVLTVQPTDAKVVF
ncbi:MAG TPA: RagB/SusD family nutrient uptake outer membrane protein, partial [Chitinophagaceae bacterium]|nr:RagB/SusD family nutrient uptake outer membrane protein [Chitinophagaceae bacterium]